MVATLLTERGFVIRGRNVRLGHLEIDIIAERGSLLVFCEVRARSSTRFGTPLEQVSRSKQERIRRAAHLYLEEIGGGVDVRFDAAGVLKTDTGFECEYVEDAF